jgi:murein DD-endopeptidase MepM/ murein hydrolase activator NlpD
MTTFACWPIRAYRDGRRPVVSSGFGEVRQANAIHPTYRHNGLDLGYRANASDPAYQGRYTANRTKHFFSPGDGLAVAADEGVVVQARFKERIRGDVWVHHEALGLVTEYAHLSAITVQMGQRIPAGHVVGVIGASADTAWIHLHFAALVAHRVGSYHDPMDHLRGAVLLDWNGQPIGPYQGGGGQGPAAPVGAAPLVALAGLAWLASRYWLA